LFEVHADRVIQNVQAPLVLIFIGLGLFDAVHFRLVNDLHFQVSQFAVKVIQFVGRDHAIGQRVVDVVVGQVALLLRQPDQFLDFLGQVQRRLGGGGGSVSARINLQSGINKICHGGGGLSVLFGVARIVPLGGPPVRGSRCGCGLGAFFPNCFFL
jgi:hypothetical protein